MQLEVGKILEGKVTGITNFGAFVDIGDGKTGMVHISEVAASFVKDIRDFLSEGQMIKVKIINVFPDGKINLSIKKATESEKPIESKSDACMQSSTQRTSYRKPTYYQAKFTTAPTIIQAETTSSFEDMLSRFKQTSDERISDLKHAENNRRSASKSRRK